MRLQRVLRDHLPSPEQAVRHGVFASWADCIEQGLLLGLWDIHISGRPNPRLPGSKAELAWTSIRLRPGEKTQNLVEQASRIFGNSPMELYRTGLHYGLCNRYSPIFSPEYRRLAEEAAVPVRL